MGMSWSPQAAHWSILTIQVILGTCQVPSVSHLHRVENGLTNTRRRTYSAGKEAREKEKTKIQERVSKVVVGADRYDVA